MLNIILFYSTCLSGLLLSYLLNPAIAFSVYEAVYFFFPENRWWGSMVPEISYSFYIVLFMMLLVALNFKNYKENEIFKVPQFKWVYILLFLYAFSSFFAVYPDDHYYMLIYFLKLVVIITVAYKLINTDKALDYVLWGYILGSWYISFYAYQIGRNTGNRLEGIGTIDAPDANGIATAIAPSLVLALYYFWNCRNIKVKALFAIAGIFIANAIILINSRGAFLSVAMSILFFMFYLYFSDFKRKFQKTMVMGIVIFGMAGLYVLADDSFLDRMSTISEETELSSEVETGSSRVFYWMAAWDMAKDHPFGAGFRGFNYYASIYIPRQGYTGKSEGKSVHSSWFEALSETGYLGFLCFFMMLFSSFISLQKCKLILKENGNIDQYYKVIAIQAALIGFIVAASFMNRLRAEVLYWIILYSASAYNIYVLKNEEHERLTNSNVEMDPKNRAVR